MGRLLFQDETTSPNHRHQEISPEEKGQRRIALNRSNSTGFRLITSLKSVLFYHKYLDKIKSILFSAIVRSSISDLSGLSRLAVG